MGKKRKQNHSNMKEVNQYQCLLLESTRSMNQPVTTAYTFIKTKGGHKHRKDDCLLTQHFFRNLLPAHVNYIMTHESNYITRDSFETTAGTKGQQAALCSNTGTKLLPVHHVKCFIHFSTCQFRLQKLTQKL